MTTFSPTDACVEGFRVARRHPGAIVVWGVFYVVVIVLAVILIFAGAGPGFVDMVKNAGANVTADPSSVLKMVGGMMVGILIALPLFLFSAVMINAAVYRAVLRPEDKGVAFLKLGGDELRLAVVAIVMFVLLMAAYLVCALIVGVLVGAVGQANQTVAGLLAVVAVIAMLCGFVYVGVKLSMASVMTFAQKKIVIFESWSFTKGQFWPLFGMYVLVLLIYIGTAIVLWLISFLLQMMGLGGMAAFSGNGGSASNFLAMAPLMIIGFLLTMAINVVSIALQMAILYAPQASAYRQLAGPEPAKVF